ncbi:hypothetical protein B0T16DRAFT_433563 [Cercophora newfieldiana]|uniref:Uncharacterized protein n=1 Tax=Cercophora newfieldiana TaxID=92897 RepID=A0AA39YQ63_9PEZI|nr:hypothetical protein B0T16DRAFT_433563 [Cercophora newfieldiana]
MATEFHFFPLLPFKLKEMIWKFAIRPTLPGAHVFSKHETTRDRCVSDNTLFCWELEPRLAAPRCLPRGVGFDPAAQAAAPISWTLNNPSAYLIDSGLWTACKESLLVIEKEFQNLARRREVWSPEEVESFRKQRGRFPLPETATYKVSDDSRHRYLTVFPDQDLFILQPNDITALNWKLVRESERHMALEYNPAWDKVWGYDHAKDTVVRGAVRDFIDDLAFSTGKAGTRFFLWFIDYRIKRNPRYQMLDEERTEWPRDDPLRTFNAKDRFVEVKPWQLGDCAEHNRMWDVSLEDNSYGVDVWIPYGPEAFVRVLTDELDGHWDYEEKYWRKPLDFDWVEYGLLACEDL